MLQSITIFLSLFLAAEARLSNFNGNGNDDEECIGLVLLTATLCLMVPMINNANRTRRYPLYSY